jgi:hypothetical protein
MPSTGTLSPSTRFPTEIQHYFPASQFVETSRATSTKLSHIRVLDIINLLTWKLHRDALFISVCETCFLSRKGGTLLQHSQHLPDVSLFKGILITNVDSKEHLQLTNLLQINKTIKGVSSYFKFSPQMSLRSAGRATLALFSCLTILNYADWQTKRYHRGLNTDRTVSELNSYTITQHLLEHFHKTVWQSTEVQHLE